MFKSSCSGITFRLIKTEANDWELSWASLSKPSNAWRLRLPCLTNASLRRESLLVILCFFAFAPLETKEQPVQRKRFLTGFAQQTLYILAYLLAVFLKQLF